MAVVGTTGVDSAVARRGRARFVLGGAALAVYGAFVVVPAARDPNTNGFAAYYTASRILLDTPRAFSRVYDDAWFQRQIDASGFIGVADIYNVQPPTMSLMLVPFAWASPGRARVAWTVFSVGLWIAGLALLAGSFSDGAVSGGRLLVLAALSAAFVPIVNDLRRGQCYALMFFLLCAAWRFAMHPDRRRAWLAGVPLGLMVVTKSAGLWLWPLLVVARRWRTLSAAAATALAVVLLAAPAVGWEAWRRFFQELPRLATDPVRYVTAYQTLTSLTGHLFVYDARWNPAPVADCRPLAIALSLAATAAVFAVSAFRQRLSSTDRGARALSWGLLTAPIVSLAPIAESYHYFLLLPAVVVALWWAARTHAAPLAWAALFLAVALLEAPRRLYCAHAVQAGWWALLAYPRLYGALVLWAWLARALGRQPT